MNSQGNRDNRVNYNRSSNAQNNKDFKNLIKLICILAGMVFLFRLWYNQMERGSEREAPEGEAISVEDVNILLQALELDINLEADVTDGSDLNDEDIKDTNINDANTNETDIVSDYLTYKQYKMIYDYIDGTSKEIPDFSDKYEEPHAFLKEDWYQTFQLMLAYYDTNLSIWKTNLFILKTDSE